MVKLRPATVEDFEQINSLLDQLTKEIAKTKKGYRHVYSKRARRQCLIELIGFGQIPIVAEAKGKIVAYVNVQELISIRHGTKELIIFEFIVDKNYRHRGLGTHIVNDIKRFASLSNYRAIKVFCGNDLADSQRFYERNGFIWENKGYKYGT